jgi:hypothetical protein
MAKGFWAGLFSPSRERFSLEELQHLHSVLLANRAITDANRDTVVEALRSISELVIWCAGQEVHTEPRNAIDGTPAPRTFLPPAP